MNKTIKQPRSCFSKLQSCITVKSTNLGVTWFSGGEGRLYAEVTVIDATLSVVTTSYFILHMSGRDETQSEIFRTKTNTSIYPTEPYPWNKGVYT